LGIALQ